MTFSSSTNISKFLIYISMFSTGCNSVDEEKFYELRKELKLKIGMDEYPTMLIKMLNNCIKDPQK